MSVWIWIFYLGVLTRLEKSKAFQQSSVTKKCEKSITLSNLKMNLKFEDDRIRNKDCYRILQILYILTLK